MLKGIIRNISTKKARKAIANVIVKAYDIAIETAIIFIAASPSSETRRWQQRRSQQQVNCSTSVSRI